MRISNPLLFRPGRRSFGRVRLETLAIIALTLGGSAVTIHFQLFRRACDYFMMYQQTWLEKFFDILLVCFFTLLYLVRKRTTDLKAEVVRREISERHAHKLATRDPLTGLYNRRFFVEHLEVARKRSQATGKSLSILLIDLDRFKPINDVYGHEVGDHVLFEVGKRLDLIATSFGETVIARMGGDEFACVIEHDRDASMAEDLARKLIHTICEPIELGVITVVVGSSIGIATETTAVTDSVELLRRADLAMYRAKRASGNAFRQYDLAMDVEGRLAEELVTELRSGLTRQEILPHYQPIAALSDGSWTGFECLARWQHPSRGILTADHFIKPAEDCGLIDNLSLSLLNRACLDAQQWPSHYNLSFNISPLQLRNAWLPEQIIQVLTANGMAPGRLIVELTESGLFADFEVARALLVSLKNAGIKLALDDFGTGYSSLSHLRDLPFDIIKIDRSFIDNLETHRDESMIKAIIRMGHSLGIKVTAEGVGSDRGWKLIKALGCDYAQGFAIGHPKSANQTLGLLSASSANGGELMLGGQMGFARKS